MIYLQQPKMVFTYEDMQAFVSSPADAGIVVIDVRRNDERKAERIPSTEHIPCKSVLVHYFAHTR